MMYPLPLRGPEVDSPVGYTYGCVVVRGAATHDEVLAELRRMRFSGWLTRPDGDWVVAVASSGDGAVAAGRRGVVGVGERLAGRFGGTVLAIRVLADRQLLLALWVDGDEVGRYVSDPSHGTDKDEDILPDPIGVEYAEAFAAACGYPDAAGDLAELLAEQLDPDSVFESERLGGVARLLGLPRWLVAVSALPHDVPTGPAANEVTRLGAGVPGLLGRVCGRAVKVVRRRRRPPPAVVDPPRGTGGPDPWLL